MSVGDVTDAVGGMRHGLDQLRLSLRYKCDTLHGPRGDMVEGIETRLLDMSSCCNADGRQLSATHNPPDSATLTRQRRRDRTATRVRLELGHESPSDPTLAGARGADSLTAKVTRSTLKPQVSGMKA